VAAPPPNVALDAITSALLEATNFIEVARAICRLGREVFELTQCAVVLTSSAGRPVLGVDNVADITDEHRLEFFRETWVLDPLLREVLIHHAPVGDELMGQKRFMKLARDTGYTGPQVYTLMLPIVSTIGILGVIRFGNSARFTRLQRRDLAVLASHASVRLAKMGVTAVIDSPLGRLTSRQREVAQLAANGRNNFEIHEALDIKLDTVKKHLKDVFRKLGVASRTELAVLLSQLGPLLDVPLGVTRLADVTITRR
jgi:DNA-binding CsgD family transcriptional regulator